MATTEIKTGDIVSIGVDNHRGSWVVKQADFPAFHVENVINSTVRMTAFANDIRVIRVYA